MAVLACAFDLYSKPDALRRPRIQSARLKLLQFVAIRPWLLPVLRHWGAARADMQQSMLADQMARRGFIGDTVFDRVVEYLVARQILSKGNSYISLGGNGESFRQIPSVVKRENLFSSERNALAEMEEIRITNSMLEGW